MKAKKKPRLKRVASGIYNAAISKVQIDRNGIVHIQLDLFGKDFIFTERVTTKPEKLSVPDPCDGHIKFFIMCSRLSIYTSIGADNIHHASNKATKLFGPGWTSLSSNPATNRDYQWVPVVEFRELIRSLAI